MTTAVVGYKLVSSNGDEVQTWGGTWGQCPGIPNPVILPNGLHVHAPSLDVEYEGYTLTEWVMGEPPPAVPRTITPRQCRIMLAQQGLLSQVESAIAQMDEATKITWEYAIEFRRDDHLLAAMATSLDLTDEQVDQMFIAAAAI